MTNAERVLRIGSRRSPLAVAQARWVADHLAQRGVATELVDVETVGDVDRRALTEIGGTGVFATVVRDQLLAGCFDVAVHSLKDLPVEPAAGLLVAAVPAREDARDVLVGARFDDLREGMTVGTGSPRRALQLHRQATAQGVQISTVPVRGNVDARLRLVTQGKLDATVLAAAGLRRLGRLAADDALDTVEGPLPCDVVALDDLLPAAGQGALAVECAKAAEPWVLAAVAAIDHEDARRAVTAERRFLARLEAGCLAPVGVHAQVTASADLTLRALTGRTLTSMSTSSDDAFRRTPVVLDALSGPAAEAARLGAALAERVLTALEAGEGV